MHRGTRVRRSVAVAVSTAMMLLAAAAVAAPPAYASGPSSGCKVAIAPAAQIGTYPAWGGQPSALRVACIFEHDTTNNDVSNAVTFHDFQNIVWHNGAARTVTVDASGIAANATTFKLTECNGIVGWKNHSVEFINDGVNNEQFGTDYTAFESFISGSCVVTMSAPAQVAAAAGTQLLIDNAAGPRVITGATISGTSITSTMANFNVVDVGRSVTGTNVPIGATIGGVTDASHASLSTAATSGSNLVLELGDTYESTTMREVHDVSTPATNQVRSVNAKFTADDVGLQVYGDAITDPAYITAVLANNTVQLGPGSPVTVDSATDHDLQIGDASSTAPDTNDPVAQLDLQVQLDPSLVALPGVRPCSENVLETVHYTGKWIAPTLNIGPANGVTIGYIQFVPTIGGRFTASGAGSLFASVVQRPANFAGDPDSSPHYDVVFPQGIIPSIGECAATASSPGPAFSLGVVSTSPSQANVNRDNNFFGGIIQGRPGTNQLRLVRDNAQTGSVSTAYLTSDSGVTYDTPNFSRLCVIPAGPPVGGFKCGTG